MIKFELIQAKHSDLQRLYEITQKGMSEVELKIHGKKKFTTEQQKNRYLKYIQEFGPLIASTKLIVVDGVSVGRLRVEDNDHSLFIGGIQLLPEYQNKGIGRVIFEGLIKTAKLENKSIQLWVHKVNQKAVRFYLSLGFKITSETDSKYEMGYLVKLNQ